MHSCRTHQALCLAVLICYDSVRSCTNEIYNLGQVCFEFRFQFLFSYLQFSTHPWPAHPLLISGPSAKILREVDLLQHYLNQRC